MIDHVAGPDPWRPAGGPTRSRASRFGYRLLLARIAHRIISAARSTLGFDGEALAIRNGIRWKLDLREVVELSIYLFGAFERNTVKAYRRIIRPGHVVLDVGANIGAHSLPMALCVGATGRVIAFEPTAYAFARLLENIRLNPDLAPRITALQAFVVDSPTRRPHRAVYASWPLYDEPGLDPVHGGKLHGLGGSFTITLDDFVRREGLGRVDLMKIDVDGHECMVLDGAQRTLRDLAPTLILEVAPYGHEEQGHVFEACFRRVFEAGYSLFDEATMSPLASSGEELSSVVPGDRSINVIGLPAGKARGLPPRRGRGTLRPE